MNIRRDVYSCLHNAGFAKCLDDNQVILFDIDLYVADGQTHIRVDDSLCESEQIRVYQKLEFILDQMPDLVLDEIVL